MPDPAKVNVDVLAAAPLLVMTPPVVVPVTLLTVTFLPFKSSVPPFIVRTEFNGKALALFKTTVPLVIEVPPVYVLFAFSAYGAGGADRQSARWKSHRRRSAIRPRSH